MQSKEILYLDAVPLEQDLRTELINARFRVSEVGHISTGLKLLERGKFQVVMINFSYLNIQKQWNVFDTIPIIRKIDPNIRIIAVTDDNTLEMERMIRMAGVFYFVVKPIDPNELIGVLSEACAPPKPMESP